MMKDATRGRNRELQAAGCGKKHFVAAPIYHFNLASPNLVRGERTHIVRSSVLAYHRTKTKHR